MDFSLSTYYPIFIYLIAVVLFAAGVLVLTHLPYLKPKKRTPVKLMPYESGMDPIGDARQRFDVKFYLDRHPVPGVRRRIAVPVSVGGGRLSASRRRVAGASCATVVFWEVLVFLVTLVVAYVYAWRKGVFQWR